MSGEPSQSFEAELTALINKHNLACRSNIPNYMLFLSSCLSALKGAYGQSEEGLAATKGNASLASPPSGDSKEEARPPLGLEPSQIAADKFNRDRSVAIIAAMRRYAKAKLPIPQEWVDELDERLLKPHLARSEDLSAKKDAETLLRVAEGRNNQ